MFDCIAVLEAEDFKAYFQDVEIVIRVGEDEVPVFKDPDDFDLWGGICQPFKQIGQADVPRFGEGGCAGCTWTR